VGRFVLSAAGNKDGAGHKKNYIKSTAQTQTQQRLVLLASFFCFGFLFAMFIRRLCRPPSPSLSWFPFFRTHTQHIYIFLFFSKIDRLTLNSYCLLLFSVFLAFRLCFERMNECMNEWANQSIN